MTTNEQKTFHSSNVEDVNGGGLRKRHGSQKPITKKSLDDSDENGRTKPDSASPSGSSTDIDSDASATADQAAKRTTDITILDHNTYWLTRIVMLRSVAFICGKSTSTKTYATY